MKAMNEEYVEKIYGAGSDDDKIRKRYLRDVGSCEPLSDEEARELAARCKKTGDREAAHRLGEAHQRLVISVALKYGKFWNQNFMDLVGVGNEGLMRAVRKFDPELGTFAGYASHWIRAYILKFLIDSHSLVKIGTTKAQRRLFFRLRGEMRDLEARGFKPDAKVIAERMNVKVSEVAEMIGRMNRDLSLDAPRHEDGESWENVLLASGSSVEDTVANLQLKALLQDMFDAMRANGNLNDREFVILNQRLYTDTPMTLEKLGEEFGVSRERVRQLESDMLKKMRRHLGEDLHGFFDDDKSWGAGAHMPRVSRHGAFGAIAGARTENRRLLPALADMDDLDGRRNHASATPHG